MAVSFLVAEGCLVRICFSLVRQDRLDTECIDANRFEHDETLLSSENAGGPNREETNLKDNLRSQRPDVLVQEYGSLSDLEISRSSG